MREHEKIEGTVENWENGKLGNDERFVRIAPESEQWTSEKLEKFKKDNQKVDK
jgi:hypothetical protein